MYFTASPSTQAKQAFNAMMEARRIAFELIRPGMACSELDGSVNEFLRKEGYGSEEQRLHRTGHGFGQGNHEAPWIAEGSEDRLAANMVITIESGIYLEGIGGPWRRGIFRFRRAIGAAETMGEPEIANLLCFAAWTESVWGRMAPAL